MKPEAWTENEFRVSTDPAPLDLDVIHGELKRSYWAEGIPRAMVEKSIRHSLCFGAYELSTGKQVGFLSIVAPCRTQGYRAPAVGYFSERIF